MKITGILEENLKLKADARCHGKRGTLKNPSQSSEHTAKAMIYDTWLMPYLRNSKGTPNTFLQSFLERLTIKIRMM